MDLYDDLDTKQRAGQIDGWSQSYQMLQTQLALKKATAKPVVQRAPPKRVSVSVSPVLLSNLVYIRWSQISYCVNEKLPDADTGDGIKI